MCCVAADSQALLEHKMSPIVFGTVLLSCTKSVIEKNRAHNL